jgi:hypothetical protein
MAVPNLIGIPVTGKQIWVSITFYYLLFYLKCTCDRWATMIFFHF